MPAYVCESDEPLLRSLGYTPWSRQDQCCTVAVLLYKPTKVHHVVSLPSQDTSHWRQESWIKLLSKLIPDTNVYPRTDSLFRWVFQRVEEPRWLPEHHHKWAATASSCIHKHAHSKPLFNGPSSQ